MLKSWTLVKYSVPRWEVMLLIFPWEPTSCVLRKTEALAKLASTHWPSWPVPLTQEAPFASRGSAAVYRLIVQHTDMGTAGVSGEMSVLPVSLECLPLGCQQLSPNPFLLWGCFLHILFSCPDCRRVLLCLEGDVRSKTRPPVPPVSHVFSLSRRKMSVWNKSLGFCELFFLGWRQKSLLYYASIASILSQVEMSHVYHELYKLHGSFLKKPKNKPQIQLTSESVLPSTRKNVISPSYPLTFPIVCFEGGSYPYTLRKHCPPDQKGAGWSPMRTCSGCLSHLAEGLYNSPRLTPLTFLVTNGSLVGQTAGETAVWARNIPCGHRMGQESGHNFTSINLPKD